MEKKPQNIPLHYLWSKGSTVKFIHLVAKKKKSDSFYGILPARQD